MHRARCSALVVLIALAAGASPALARRNTPASTANAGEFDYYLLSLSWSPQHCRTHPSGDTDTQCGLGRHYGFVVHGLWPQYENGNYPSECGTATVPDAVVTGAMDILPSEDLIQHEWRKHGSCSGLTPDAYFTAARRAFGATAIPARYEAPSESFQVTAAEVRQDFRRANPDISSDGLAVICDGKALQEVRVCLGKDLAPRKCGRRVSDTCHGQTTVRPVSTAGEPRQASRSATTAAAAEYALRWDPAKGGPKTALAAMHVLDREPEDTDHYEVTYFDFRAPAGGPQGFHPILRRRLENGKKHELMFKDRGDHALSSWTCPLPGARSKDEVDVTLSSSGNQSRAYSYSCKLESEDPIEPPAGLEARPKKCNVTMTRLEADKIKVEEWHLPGNAIRIEVSRRGNDSKTALKKFRREIAKPLLAAHVTPSGESKTELGSDCD